jgi:LuxR family maltose regulon positive regulatory protein
VRSAPHLTPAQGNVLAALISTGSTLEIAGQLHLSRNTVKTHLRTLYRAIGAHTRTEALAAAARYGLLR